MANFSERIRELRRKRGITQTTLGKVIEVGPDSISTYEKGKYYPEVRKLIILADYFGVSIDNLVGRTDDPEVHQLPPPGAPRV